MGLPIEHTKLLRQQDFVVPASTGLDERERLLLLRYGRWLEALSSGVLDPVTPEQEHFVRVANGSEAPSTEFERAWMKLLQMRSATAEGGSPALPCVGPLEVASACEDLASARRAAAAVQAAYEQKREAVLELVRSQLEAVDAEFAEPLRLTSEVVERLEAELKELVLQHGQSHKHEGIQVVYLPGRVSWDSRGLRQYAQTHPEVEEFRKVGAPSASIRYKPAE